MGSGGAARRFQGERWENRGWAVGGEGADRWAPSIDEREREGGRRGWLAGPTWPKVRGERRFFFIFQLIFKGIFNLNFEQIFLLRNSHITK